MKIYFTASMRGKDQYRQHYFAIVKTLKDLGHKVKADHIMEKEWDDIHRLTEQEKIDFYKKMVGWLADADLVVAEVSYPSVNVGHEISLSLEKGKPVIALYDSENQPHLLQGLVSEKLLVLKYTLKDLSKSLKGALDLLAKQKDERFTLLLPPKILTYLDFVAREKRVPRAVFIRRLIEAKLEKDKDFGLKGTVS